ncbi:MAG: selenoneine synthase SenA [Burkholderiaceae bacterium]
MSEARCLARSALVEAMRECRARTIAWTCDLGDAQWRVPQQPGINPIAWELAHLAWFAEFWILRGPHDVDAKGRTQARRPAMHAGPDTLLDSSLLAHADRWSAPLPSREKVFEMMASQLEACIDAVPDDDNDDALYFHRLALFHEDMHGEAFAWLRAKMGYPPPFGVTLERLAEPGRVEVRGGAIHVGSSAAGPGFAFDNELLGRDITVADFEIDACPVTAGQYLRFVESGGYDRSEYWTGEAGVWRAQAKRSHPERWRRMTTHSRSDVRWEVRWFDRWKALDPEQPVIHVNAFEAEAYCLWATRRLPSAAQWEYAARRVVAFEWRHRAWEWTTDAFEPYPGFVAGPYKEYSAPWFGNHRELRGGAFATHARMHDARYRNFFTPERSDVFAGFRTIAHE